MAVTIVRALGAGDSGWDDLEGFRQGAEEETKRDISALVEEGGWPQGWGQTPRSRGARFYFARLLGVLPV